MNIVTLTLRAAQMEEHGEIDLFHCIHLTQHAICEDPRDRIYANINMLSSTLRDRIDPDYGKILRHVYTNAFLQYVTVYENRLNALKLLLQCGERTLDENLPTWVPNWSTPRRVNELQCQAESLSILSEIHPKTTFCYVCEYL